MIATLVQVAKEMARYEAKLRGTKDEIIILNRLCESAIKGKEMPKVAVLDVTNEQVQLEDYKDDERYRYLFALSKGNSAVGPAWRLSFKRNEGINERDKRIRTGLRKIGEALAGFTESSESLSPEEQSRVKMCREELRESGEKWVAALKAKAQEHPVMLLTITCNGQFVGDWKGIRKVFTVRRVLSGRRAESQGEGHCAVCGKIALVRSAIPFDFFTIEKQGFSPMGFEEMVWKYAPVCEECAKWLHVAQSYLQENLSTRVAGKAAYLVPDLEPGAADIKGSFIHYLWEWHERTEGRMVPDEDFPQTEEQRESTLPNFFEGLVEDYDKRFGDKPPFRSASLIFYQPGQKFLFLYATSEILPRNLQKASQRLKALRALLHQKVLGDSGMALSERLRSDFEFVGLAWRWLRTGQTELQGSLKLTPMHLAEAILTDRRPPERIFWSDADKLLQATYLEWVRNRQQQQRSLHSVLAERAGLIWAIWALIYGNDSMGGDSVATQPVTQAVQELSPEFWEAFFKPRMLLDSAPKRAMFLIGVLFGRVEWRQQSERDAKWGEMPIVSRLRGLTISRDEIAKRLLPELMLKIRQLDGNTRAVREIQQAAADCATHGGELSDEEARYCFCLGWTLSRLVIDEVEKVLPKKEEGEESEKALDEGDET